MNTHFRVAGRLARKLEELGVSAAAVLRRAGLPQDLFQQTRVLLTTVELFALWRAIGAVSTDPTIGLKLGIETKTERFHPSGVAALSAPTFGAAVNLLARYKQLTVPEEMLQETNGDEWSIRFHWLLAIGTEPPMLIECCFAWMMTIARHGSGTQISPVRIEFAAPRAQSKLIERHFSCPVVCDAARNAMVFRASDADLPFVTRNAEMDRYYLGNSVLELNEAAYLLGYEDAKSFTRAFRTWEGMPPNEWRETHRAIPVS